MLKTVFTKCSSIAICVCFLCPKICQSNRVHLCWSLLYDKMKTFTHHNLSTNLLVWIVWRKVIIFWATSCSIIKPHVSNAQTNQIIDHVWLLQINSCFHESMSEMHCSNSNYLQLQISVEKKPCGNNRSIDFITQLSVCSLFSFE